MSDIASAFSIPRGSLEITDLCSGTSRTSIFRADRLASQTSVVWSQRCSKIMASSLLSDHDQQRDDSDEVRLMHLPQERSERSCSGTLKHINFLTSEHSVEFLGRTIRRFKNGNTPQNLWSLARSQLQGSNFKLSQKIRRLSATKSFIKNSGQLLANLFGWLSSGMTSSIRSRSYPGHSSVPKIRTSKISFNCSSMSITQETSSLSWSLSFQSGIRKASFRFRLSAIQIQIGQVVKNQGSQQVVHWCQYSISIFSQQAELRHQLLIPQQRVNSMQ